MGANPIKYITIIKPDEVLIPEKEYHFVSMDSITVYGNTNLLQIKRVIGKRESQNQYNITNSGGCMGKYQFSKSTLKTVGYNKNEIKNFLIDTLMQEEAMSRLVEANYKWLKSTGLLKYNNRVVGDIKITTEGMLAACHLLGGESLRDYLQSEGSMIQYTKVLHSGRSIYIRKYDGNNTSIKDYLILFKINHDRQLRNHQKPFGVSETKR